MAAPSMVFTARYAASRLGIDIDVIEELAEQMAPEDGCLSVVDSFDEMAESVTAFTRQGLQYLDGLLDQRRSEFMKDT
ncbi:hypothetical protein OLX02_15835 [Novosphingobium sp. KCTC 2891]|uniref:hypothetical protein n=1 Tax=Novosphingobium sp. KCTC 2891 TaxID=2989730 RepID=UPI00222383DD|nr:hypothetical protein [Novosphingobium sp. KCTC 2891]MCW1384294.1 hypothetical protein [Novosphingobium sp. KCTC 2891]